MAAYTTKSVLLRSLFLFLGVAMNIGSLFVGALLVGPTIYAMFNTHPAEAFGISDPPEFGSHDWEQFSEALNELTPWEKDEVIKKVGEWNAGEDKMVWGGAFGCAIVFSMVYWPIWNKFFPRVPVTTAEVE